MSIGAGIITATGGETRCELMNPSEVPHAGVGRHRGFRGSGGSAEQGQTTAPRVSLPCESSRTSIYLNWRGSSAQAPRPVISIPASAVQNGAVFVVLDGHAVRRAVKVGSTSGQNARIESGLIGGEDLVVNPPAGLKDGQRVQVKS